MCKFILCDFVFFSILLFTVSIKRFIHYFFLLCRLRSYVFYFSLTYIIRRNNTIKRTFCTPSAICWRLLLTVQSIVSFYTKIIYGKKNKSQYFALRYNLLQKWFFYTSKSLVCVDFYVVFYSSKSYQKLFVVLNAYSHFAIILAGHGYQMSVIILRNVI